MLLRVDDNSFLVSLLCELVTRRIVRLLANVKDQIKEALLDGAIKECHNVVQSDCPIAGPILLTILTLVNFIFAQSYPHINIDKC